MELALGTVSLTVKVSGLVPLLPSVVWASATEMFDWRAWVPPPTNVGHSPQSSTTVRGTVIGWTFWFPPWGLSWVTVNVNDVTPSDGLIEKFPDCRLPPPWIWVSP